MRFHHMCIVTPNVDRQVEMWRDLMGFKVVYKGEIPDGEEFLPSVMAPRKLLEDLYKVPGASATVAVMMSDEGAMMELLQPHIPDVRLTPIEKLGYADSGFHELGIATTDIDQHQRPPQFFSVLREQIGHPFHIKLRRRTARASCAKWSLQ